MQVGLSCTDSLQRARAQLFVDVCRRREGGVVLEVTTSGIDKARAFPQLQFDCNPFRFAGTAAASRPIACLRPWRRWHQRHSAASSAASCCAPHQHAGSLRFSLKSAPPSCQSTGRPAAPTLPSSALSRQQAATAASAPCLMCRPRFPSERAPRRVSTRLCGCGARCAGRGRCRLTRQTFAGPLRWRRW